MNTRIDPTSASPLARITVVMATFHSGHCAADLGRCLAGFPHVIVVDNASSDDTVATLQQSLPHAQIVVNARNLGFGAANNRAIQMANTEFVLLLNPDCLIDEQAAMTLVRTADEYPAAAAVGPQLLDRRGHLDLSYCLQANGWPTRGPAAEGDISVGFLSGACMLIRIEALRRVHGFDEDFFLYQEDTDLCVRMAKHHGELILSPHAHVTHFSRGSSSGAARYKAEYIRGYHHIQSKFIYELKHQQSQVSMARRLRYCLLAATELLIRLMLLDLLRASRVGGRLAGAWRYRSKPSIRQQAMP